MIHRRTAGVPPWLLAGILALAVPAACGKAVPPDTRYAEMQQRGNEAMGVDQYTSSHVFDALPDGGRIELQRDVVDSQGVATIRRHLQDVATSFRAGDFRVPGFVHAQEVPGTGVMAQKREHIFYVYSDLPRGGQLRIMTSDTAAIRAIHEFMAFQRRDHRAGGHEH